MCRGVTLIAFKDRRLSNAGSRPWRRRCASLWTRECSQVLADVLQLLINQGESVRELRTHPSYSIRSLTIV